MSVPASMEVYPMRILPGGEITSLLQQAVSDLGFTAPFIVSCVGSVKSVILRFATDSDHNHAVSDINENLEICSLAGTLSKDGYHLHGTFGNAKGGTVSGHVMGNMVVQTTAEIVLGNAKGFEFSREFDEKTGFNELSVKKAEEKCENKSDIKDDLKADEDSDAPLSKKARKDTTASTVNIRSCSEETSVTSSYVPQSFPTDEDIKSCVTKILEGANLEEITMKTVCKQVYKNYPNHDLTHKKDLIKDTVRSLIAT